MCHIKPGGKVDQVKYDTEDSDAPDLTEDSDTEDSGDDAAYAALDNVLNEMEARVYDDVDEDVDQQDPLVMAIRQARSQNVRMTPPPIRCDELGVDISFHPKENLLVSAAISGDLYMYSYNDHITSLVKMTEVHTKACRAVEYTESGDSIITISKDRSIMITDGQTVKLKDFYDKSHESPLYCLTTITENVFATGDETGVIKVWDLRQRAPTFTLKDVGLRCVTSLKTNASKRYLACTSSEGFLTTINLPARKLHVQSEQFKTEYTCTGVYRDDTKLAVGTTDGEIVMYNWGEFGLHNDVFPTTGKRSLNCQVPVSSNISITGWDDGQIRAMYICPNRMLGIVGQQGLSVEALDVDHNGDFVASCALDQTIHFWRISFLNNLDYNTLSKSGTSNLPSSLYTDRKTFFADLETNN